MSPRTQTIDDLVQTISNLARRAVLEYAPIVDSILRIRSRNIGDIEHTLDGLLDFCFDPRALLLYKRLCRHYYSIDPPAAAYYVHAYREMWDSENNPSDRESTEEPPRIEAP